MKKALFILGALALVSLSGLPLFAQSASCIDSHITNIDDYRKSPDGTPRYVSIRGFMCQAIWECDGILTCTAGNMGLETEDGKPYFSPLLWALLDYEHYSDKNHSKVEFPYLQGNSSQQARELVIKLVQENNNNCVNDSFGGCFTPLLLAQNDAEIIRLLLKQGADPNKAKYLNGSTLLYIAAIRGQVDVVQDLLSHGANPTVEFNPGLQDLLSRIMAKSDPNELKCIALILKALLEWEQ